MKKEELIKLKKLLKEELNRRNRINELLSNDLIQEFMYLNKQNMKELEIDKWLILEEILKEFKITESNGILVCTGSYRMIDHAKEWWGGDYNSKKLPFNYNFTEYQTFKDIETNKVSIAFKDKYIKECIEEMKLIHAGMEMDYPNPREYCRYQYDKELVSDITNKYIVLNPYSSSENDNGFKDVQKDYFMTSIEKGQPTAKKLILSKYKRM